MYGIIPRAPTFPVSELERKCDEEGFVAKRLQMLKKAKKISVENSMEVGD
jgi:hypothetical protein